MLLVYGGKGKKEQSFDDIWALCLENKNWKEIVRDGHPHNSSALAEPQVRWKTFHATGAAGLYVMGGSELIQDDLEQYSNGKDYYNDVWLYSLNAPQGQWVLLDAGTNALADLRKKKKKHNAAPAPRRSHVGIVYQTPDGGDVLVVTGGRTQAGDCLNDVWSFDVTTKSWTELFPDSASSDAPQGRKGSVGFPAPHPTGEKPYLVIHGGRPEVGYFGDVWAFDLNTNEWELWFAQPEAAAGVPEPRDHHVGQYYNNRLYIHGGRGGIDRVWENAKQFSDLWVFDIPSRTWTELSPAGRRPIGRWLHTLTGYQTKKAERIHSGVEEVNKFLITGGENMDRCYLNDVWVFDMDALEWDMVQMCTFCEEKCRKSVAPFESG